MAGLSLLDIALKLFYLLNYFLFFVTFEP